MCPARPQQLDAIPWPCISAGLQSTHRRRSQVAESRTITFLDPQRQFIPSPHAIVPSLSSPSLSFRSHHPSLLPSLQIPAHIAFTLLVYGLTFILGVGADGGGVTDEKAASQVTSVWGRVSTFISEGPPHVFDVGPQRLNNCKLDTTAYF